MGKRTIKKHFDRLGAVERFHLMLAAASRQDHSEVQRLATSCPRKPYTMNDMQYTEPVRASRRVALVWALRWEQAYGLFLLVHAIHAPRLPEDKDTDPGSDLPESVLGPLLIATAEVLGVYLGLRWFCEGAGINADHLVGAWCGWVMEPVQAVLDADPFVILDDSEGSGFYATRALGVAAETEAMLNTEWGGGR